MNYLYEASLGQILGQSKHIRVIEAPSAYSEKELLTALLFVEDLLTLGHRALIYREFWDTPPGQTLMHAQWVAYGHEAIYPTDTILLLWGRKPNERYFKMLDRIVGNRVLIMYQQPSPSTRSLPGGEQRVSYCRRSDVLKLAASGKVATYTQKKKWREYGLKQAGSDHDQLAAVSRDLQRSPEKGKPQRKRLGKAGEGSTQ